jgi:hypothetical protein
MSAGTPPSSSGGAPGFNYQVPKKPFYRRPLGIVLIVVGVFILLSIVGGIAGGGDSDGTVAASDDSSESNSTDKKDKSDAEEPKEAPEPEWKTVAKLSGNTNKAGPDFHLNGCDTRMTYKVEGDVSSTIVAFYVMESGTKLMEDGGIPVASPTKAGPG